MQRLPLFPAPLTWLRAIFQAIAFMLSLMVLEWGIDEGIITVFTLTTTFGTLLIFFLPIGVIFFLHFVLSQLLYFGKGISRPHWIDSLWEGIYGWMTIVFAWVMVLLLIVIPVAIADLQTGRFSRTWEETDFPDSLLIPILGIYFVVSLYLYHLEHLIRHRNKTQTPPPSTPPKTVPKTKLSAPPKTTQQATVNVTPDDIDQELDIPQKTSPIQKTPRIEPLPSSQ